MFSSRIIHINFFIRLVLLGGRTASSDGYIKLVYLLPQNKNGVFEVYNITGQLVYQMNLPAWSTLQFVKFPEMSNGVYTCVIKSGYDRVGKKLVLMKWELNWIFHFPLATPCGKACLWRLVVPTSISAARFYASTFSLNFIIIKWMTNFVFFALYICWL